MTRRPWLVLFAAAFLLRGGAALLTERWPLFPDYYYTDARFMDAFGDKISRRWAEGGQADLPGSASQRFHGAYLAILYTAFGHVPLIPKLLNAAAGAGTVSALYLLAVPVFGPGPAFAAAALTAVWPSHVFFTSQLFKDALVALFGTVALMGFLLRPAWVGALALGASGFLRAYVMIVTTAAIVPSILWRRAWISLLLLAASFAGQRLISRTLLDGPLKVATAQASDISNDVSLIPSAGIQEVKPLSPRGISEFRRIRQEADQQWADLKSNRGIGTQLFYGESFESWLDVALFLPKAAFHVLFMPLPLLYPLGTNLGRWAAAGENTALLLLSLAAAAGAWRGPRTPASLALLLFFGAMTAGSALLEFDLGSATRHKILYFPFLFPFAFAGARPYEKRKGKRRVAQVIECGGPGGTGSQVAFLCREIDAETILVYNVREGRPEDYASLCKPARAHHVPEFTREISPLRDLRAFLRLYRIFKQERPDVVHAHSSKAGALARPAAWLAGVPLIYYSPHGYGFLQADRGRCSRLLYKLAEWLLSWIGAVVAVSPGEAALAAPLAWGKPVETVLDPYLGGDLPSQPQRKTPPLVGSCGRLTAARRPEAFSRLKARLPEARFLWIGGGQTPLEGVETTGWLPGPQALERMAGLDVLVHYSAWDALPNAVLEGMALGLPIVASEAARDALGEAGLYAASEDELLAQVKRLLAEPELRRTLGSKARQRVRDLFSKDRALQALGALYGR
jgi:glycosyltransferase involved in cell wall biosynthesis